MKFQLTIPYHASHNGSYNIHLISLSLLFITACSVFKEKSFYQADSLLRRNTRTEIKTEVQTQSQGFRIYTSEDSTNKQSFTEIFPEGVFKYSAKEGFQGKAGRVVINEKVREERKVRDSVGLSETSKMKAELKQTDRVVNRNRLKEKEVEANNYSLFYLAGCVMVFVMVYIFRKNLKS